MMKESHENTSGGSSPEWFSSPAEIMRFDLEIFVLGDFQINNI